MLPFFMFTLSLEGFRPRPTLPHPSGIPRQNRPTWASHSTFHSRQSTSFFSHYYALFCTAQNPNSFRFIFFRTLCTKHPGWGIPPSPIACSRLSISSLLATHLPRASRGHMPLSPLGATLTEKRGGGAPNLAWGGFQERAEEGGHLICRRD